MNADNAYNSEMYRGPKCKANTQEDYCTPVYDAWCRGKETKDEHQKPTSSIIGSGGPINSSAKPKQQA